MKLVAVVGSAAGSGKTRAAVEAVVRSALDFEPTLQTDIIDLSVDQLPLIDGRSQIENSELAETILRARSGSVFLLATPIYRGTYTGALKNFLDQLPLEALEGRVVGVVGTGATLHHYLAIDHQVRGLLAWFNAYVLPGSVYLDSTAFSGATLTGPEQIHQLQQLGESLISVSRRLEGVPALPACLTRQMLQRTHH